APGALRRSHQVKVTLNAVELAFLDGLVGQMGSDRSSVFRHLLRLAGGSALQEPSPGAVADQTAGEPPPVTRIELKGLSTGGTPPATVKLYEPRSFDELPDALKALDAGAIILLNLTMMEPDQAQRAVDFTAGGTFSLKGHQERVGEAIFLFAPRGVSVEQGSDSEDPARLKGHKAILLKEGKPAEGERGAAEPAASQAAAIAGSGSEAASDEQAGGEQAPAEDAGTEPISAGPIAALASGLEPMAEDAMVQPVPEPPSGKKPTT
ncbi:MAG: cell division protein SepF, partial [Cyanobium sp.]